VKPFLIGLPQFPEGMTDGPLSLNIAEGQVVPLVYWPDGSIKFAAAAGHGTFVANTDLTISVVETSSSGTNLTPANVAASSAFNVAGQNYVDLGVGGIVDLSTLLASPLMTVMAGPQHEQIIYGKTQSGVFVEFHVDYYKFGSAEIYVAIDNGWVDIANADRAYTCKIVIGGVTVFGPTAITHLAHTRVQGNAWVGITDPALVPTHNVADIVASKLMPNFFGDAPPASFPPGSQNEGLLLTGLVTAYTRGGNGNWDSDSAGPGFHNAVGWTPTWDNLFITSQADNRAYKSVLANSEILAGTQPIVWRGSTDTAACLPSRPSVYPTYTFEGPNGGGFGTPGLTADGVNFWEDAHHGSGGYLAWLLTAKWRFKQIMDFQSALCYLCENSSSARGTGVNKIMFPQTRGMAWRLRTWGQLASVAPTGDLVATDYRAVASRQIDVMLATSQLSGQNTRGIAYDAECRDNVDSLTVAQGRPWQKEYLGDEICALIDTKALTDLTNTIALRDFTADYLLGLLGENTNGTTYPFTYAANSLFIEGPTSNTPDYTDLYDDWVAVFNANKGVNFTDNGINNTLQGGGAATPGNAAKGYWGYILPWLSRLIDQDVPQAQSAYNRLTSAANWLDVRNCVGTPGDNFGTIPTFGVSPRSALSKLLATMAPGSWKAVSGSQLASVAYNAVTSAADYNSAESTAIQGGSGVKSVFEAWAGAAFDTLNRRVVIPAQGGHHDYYGNEVYIFSLETLTWSRVTTPSDIRGLNISSGNPWVLDAYPDGNPFPHHSYCANVYMPSNNKILCASGGSESGGSNRGFIFDMAAVGAALPTLAGWTHTPTYTSPFGGTIGSGVPGLCACWDGTSNRVFIIGNDNNLGGAWYDPVANTYAFAAVNAVLPDYHMTGALDTATGELWCVGPFNLTKINLATLTTTQNVAWTGNAGGLQGGFSYPGWEYHPPSGNFVGWTGGNTLVLFNPVTKVFTQWTGSHVGGDTVPAFNDGGGVGSGCFKRWIWDAVDECFILANRVTENVYVYKPDF